MTLRLLSIANPERYLAAATDVPLGYARLAAHPEVTLYHADTAAMTSAVSEPEQGIPCVRVPRDFDPASFGALSAAPTLTRAPDAFDLAFCRTLKPFPPGYLDRLEAWARHVPFLNHPAGIRRQLAPDFLLEAASAYLPASLLAHHPEELDGFLAAHEVAVAKRANSCGGRGVFRVRRLPGARVETDNVVDGSAVHADVAAAWNELAGDVGAPVLLMRYLPRVTGGDKRLVVVGGEIQGAYLRRSQRGHWVQNVSQGARCERVAASDADRALVAATRGPYAALGIRLLGYDLIEDDGGAWRISEINAGNVGGLFRLEALGEPDLTDRFVRFLQDVARQGPTGVASARCSVVEAL